MAILTSSTISRVAGTAQIDFQFPAATIQFDYAAEAVDSAAVPVFVASDAPDYIAAVRDLVLWLRACEGAFGLRSGNPAITHKVEIEASPTVVQIRTIVNGTDHTTKWAKATNIVQFKRTTISLDWTTFGWWVRQLELFAQMVQER